MKFSLVTISFFVSVLLATHVTRMSDICPRQIPAQYSHIKPGNVVAAYVASWNRNYNIHSIHKVASKLTHLIYAFVVPNPDTGKCELMDPWIDIGAGASPKVTIGGNFKKLLQLKQAYPHLKILLSIGGGKDSKYISEIVRKNLVDEFVQSCGDILDRYEYKYQHHQDGSLQRKTFEYENLFDGIDFDWEWHNNNVSKKDAQAFEKIVVGLRKIMDERFKVRKQKQLLTVAMQVSSSVYNALPLDKITQHIDWYHAMTYDFAGFGNKGTGFNAPLCNPSSVFSVDSAVSNLIDVGVAPDKIVLGLPLYGKVFDNTTSIIGASFDKTNITRVLSYSAIKKSYLQNKGCNYGWNKDSSVPYVYCPKDKVFVSFDDRRSLKHKVDYARQKLLNGVFLWQIALDDEDHTLVKSL